MTCTGLRLQAVFASHESLDSGHAFVDEPFLVEVVGATDRRRRRRIFVLETVGR